MADYPSVVQAYGTLVRGQDGTVVERAVSGKPRFRSYYTLVRDTIGVVHDLDETDRDLIEAHYATDRLLAFVFNFDGTTTPTQYTVRYASPPQYRPIPGNRWQVKVSLVVV